MNLGVLLPTRSLVMSAADPRRPASEVMWSVLEHAEEAGYAHAWVGDSIVAKPRHDPLLTLAYAAARTSRIRLGTAVLLPPLRHPVVLAHQLATLDHLTQGRLVLGVGPGWPVPMDAGESAATGHDVHRRGRNLDEHLEVWRELWSGRPVTRTGPDYALEGHTIGPLPWTEHGPELWITAGNRGEYVPRAFARFGRHGDGIISDDVTPEEAAEVRRRGDQALAEAGRELGRFPLAVYLTVRVDDDRALAERRFAEFIAAYYPKGYPSHVEAPVGDAAAVARVLARYAAAGATDLILRFAGDDQLEHVRRFTAGVRPLLDPAPLLLELEAALPEASEAAAAMYLQALAIGLAPSAGLDLAAAGDHAQTFLDNFPPMSLPFGDVDQRAARWLAQLLDKGNARSNLRARLAQLADTWQDATPRAAAQVRAWSAGPPPADPREDGPWFQALVALTRTRLPARS